MNVRTVTTALLFATLGLAGCFFPVERRYGDWDGPRYRRRYVVERRYDWNDHDRDRRDWSDRHRDWYDD
jgi:hypothetical protein